MTALVVSLVFGGGFVLAGFFAGRVYERQPPVPVRHASHHHRPARHVRCVALVPFDFEADA